MQFKTLFLTIFDPGSLNALTFSNCHLYGVIKLLGKKSFSDKNSPVISSTETELIS